MGWAIKRSDGTYRCWNGITQDDVVQPGEVWEEHAVAPPITAPVPTPAQLAAHAAAQMAENKLIAAVVLWAAGHFGVAPATAKQEILTIYQGLP